jgi:(p)ppGpp synthase/HD superfamily hydrolase
MSFPKLEKAIEFASRAHRGHYRKGVSGLPYIVHPMDVLFKVRHLGGITDEDVLAAAVLHDVVEDTGMPLSEIETAFGNRVSCLVGQLTRRFDKNEDLYSEMMLDDIRSMDSDAQVIKLCDRLDNLWEMERTLSKDRTHAYAREALKMLDIIPRERAPELWDKLRTLTLQVLESR